MAHHAGGSLPPSRPTASTATCSRRSGAWSPISARTWAPAARAVAVHAGVHGPRAGYFRSELMAALKIIDRGDIPAEKLAAPGQAPSARRSSCLRATCVWRRRRGRQPRHRRFADAALASTANYFAKSGWRSGAPWGFEVKLPPGYAGPSGRRAKAPMSAWAARGIAASTGARSARRGWTAHARRARRAGLPRHEELRRHLFLQRGRVLFARRLRAGRPARGGRGIQTPWPTDDPGLSRAGRRELQTRLAQRGYDVGKPDGAIGAKTKAAIADFQQRAGLPVDGRASTKVLEALQR